MLCNAKKGQKSQTPTFLEAVPQTTLYWLLNHT